ncbi:MULTISPECIES: hypothetical protein [unclassified Pseudomonas]|uniref:hypothetical protein n=1 Tax=unclassified Pseudomonas TaxID=196821 RepID=UPI001FF0AF48|nr:MULTISPECIES: hypothetical protein [unclassified Pseudomonas]
MKIDRDLLWPILEKPSAAEIQGEKDAIAKQQLLIQKGDWTLGADVALDEARRLYDAEAERRRSADTKAGIYFAAITALVPVLTSLIPSIWSDKASAPFAITSLLIFALAVCYLVKAGLWAFHTLKVSRFHQVHSSDLVRIANSSESRAALAKEITQAVNANYSLVNEKVTCIKMTHEFLLRAFFAFALLMAVQGVWPPVTSAIDWAKKRVQPNTPIPLIMCYS